MTIITKAYFYAEEKHRDQVYGEKPFIYHLEQTFSILKTLMPQDHNLLAAGFLHDSMEDQKVTYEELKEAFNEDIACLVKEVTKSEYNTFPNLKSVRGVILLTASRLCNLTNMQGWSEEQIKRYLIKSKFWKS